MAELWRRVGVIVNPSAGSGFELSRNAIQTALSSIGAQEVLTGAGQTGAAALAGWSGVVIAHGIGGAVGRDQTRILAQWLTRQDIALIVVVGGDGTLADVAQVCVETGCRTPLIGIGAGSTNVGRLMTCRANDAAMLSADRLETWNVDCLAASLNGELMGVGFNDVVIGCTIVGTIDGRVRDVDAAARLRGEVKPGAPRSVATSETTVTRAGNDGRLVVAQGLDVGTVVAGFAEPEFFGKAVCGGVCLAALTGLPAGCLVSSLPLVQVEITAAKLLGMPPIRSSYVSISEGTSILVEKVADGAVLCVDGNPLRLLNPSDEIVISVLKNNISGVRFRRGLRSA
jgi:NAD kinase